MQGFREKLAERQKKVKSLVCVGLDPLVEKIPPCLLKDFTIESAVEVQMLEIARKTAEFASMFKPQIGCWLAIPEGLRTLKKIIQAIHHESSDIPVILDCKCGDIARTQKQYGTAYLDGLGADGMNFSPYMGEDCMEALVNNANIGRALVSLCYTSNPKARKVQDVIVNIDGRKMAYWEYIAECVLAWAQELGVVENAGLVMAAAYAAKNGLPGAIHSSHLTRCREIVGDKLWFLIPGIGTQGGFVAETVRTAYAGPGSIAINSSSEICFASSGEDFPEAAGKKACELRDQINESLMMGQIVGCGQEETA